MDHILKIENLHVDFFVQEGISHILNGLNLEVKKGHLVGVVGESGAGKSVMANAIMGAVRKPGKFTDGNVIYKGTNLLELDDEKLRKARKGISLIAANARGHLNPVATVGQQISDVYRSQRKCSKKEGMRKAIEMLGVVGLTDPEQRAKSYPHELSGGMAQRCIIAMALVNSPDFLIADDATNGLDVTVQAQIMELILQLLKERDMSGIFITHDLGVVAQCCNEIAIMYCGQIVEFAPVAEFFKRPMHPYSKSLINSLPERRVKNNGPSMWDFVPDPLHIPKGCMFCPRCLQAAEQCKSNEPEMKDIGNGHFVMCHYALQGGCHE